MASDSEEAPFARAVLVTLAVLALYVLSEGPVFRAALYGERPPWVRRLALTAYRPITWTAERCEPLENALLWYDGLWMPLTL